MLTIEPQSETDWQPEGGRRLEPWDEAPEGYWHEARKMVVFQAVAEIAGTALLGGWEQWAPTYFRKQVMTAKNQDEIGHGHICVRVAEDLGVSRDDIIEGILSGRYKMANVFHYDVEDWAELAPAMLLNNLGATAQFLNLVKCSYGPYVRCLKKIIVEEGFHTRQALDLLTVLWNDDPERWREGVEAGIRKWYPIVNGIFGPDEDPAREELLRRWNLRPNNNEHTRQRWLDLITYRFGQAGIDLREVADAKLEKDEASGRWAYTPVDWEEWRRVTNGGGPASEKRKEQIRHAWERHRWVRDALAA